MCNGCINHNEMWWMSGALVSLARIEQWVSGMVSSPIVFRPLEQSDPNGLVTLPKSPGTACPTTVSLEDVGSLV